MESNKQNEWHKFQISKLKFKRNKIIKQNNRIHITLITLSSVITIFLIFGLENQSTLQQITFLGIYTTFLLIVLMFMNSMDKTKYDQSIINNHHELLRRHSQ